MIRSVDVFVVARRIGLVTDTTIAMAVLGIPFTRTQQDSGLVALAVILMRILS